MNKALRPYDPNQQFLFPAALRGWLPPNHPARFISDVVDQLDLSAITAATMAKTGAANLEHPHRCPHRHRKITSNKADRLQQPT